MRRPSVYEEYLYSMKQYFKIKQQDCPQWVDKAKQYYNYLFYMKKRFSTICSGTSISKSMMEYLSKLKDETYEGLPEELVVSGIEFNSVLIDMYNELTSNIDLYFINEWTLSKQGRHKMREYVDRIPTANGIMPPVNEFTNVPDSISFRDRIYSCETEYSLTVSLNGLYIYINNGDSRNKIRTDFTERFLEKIIPMIQWEKIEHLLRDKDWSKNRDETIYQNYKTVFVEVGKNECDLNLLASNENNPFIDVLKLVWEEYKNYMIDNGIVLPWFRVLGW